MRTTFRIVGVLAGLVAGVAAEREAKACGGCFAPPGENASVVTDHRMVLSISSEQTTLYDQIHYSGSPSSFAWVLPIADSNKAQLGLSADVVFASLHVMTQSQVLAPALNCPSPPDSCRSLNAAPSAAGDADHGGVTVNKHEVVGPYVTDYLHSTDPQALNTWLADHGYSIPADVQPVIAQYVSEHYDFIAMKLVPGQGIDSMRPVRVTTPGAAPRLPLRMVAAGTGATVGITLWVIGEGRYDTDNFPSFTIGSDDLVWDWTTSSSNFATLRDQKQEAAGHRIWEIESSLAFSQDQVANVIRSGGFYYGGGGGGGAPYPGAYDAGSDYTPIDGDDAGTGQSAEQVREADLKTLFEGIDPANTRITRVRSDLAHASLDKDLFLRAAADQAVLSNVRVAKHEANQPPCPVYNGCDVVGTLPRDQAAAETAKNTAKGSGGTFSCTAAPPSSNRALAASALAGLVGLAAIFARARRARRGSSRR